MASKSFIVIVKDTTLHGRVLWILASYWINCICRKMFTSNGYFGLAWYFIAILHTYKQINWYTNLQKSQQFTESNSLTFDCEDVWAYLQIQINYLFNFFPATGYAIDSVNFAECNVNKSFSLWWAF